VNIIQNIKILNTNTTQPTQQQVKDLICRVEDKVSTRLQKTAYNYLFDYIEDVWHMTHEGEGLLTICWMILEEIDSKCELGFDGYCTITDLSNNSLKIDIRRRYPTFNKEMNE
jgi:hypothetical protein